MKKKEKKTTTGGKLKALLTALLLAPTFATCNAVSTRFSYTATSWNMWLVGDVKAPLLRTVNITGKEGLTVNRIFSNSAIRSRTAEAV